MPHMRDFGPALLPFDPRSAFHVLSTVPARSFRLLRRRSDTPAPQWLVLLAVATDISFLHEVASDAVYAPKIKGGSRLAVRRHRIR